MSTCTLTKLKTKSAKLISSADNKLASASTNIMKVEWKMYKSEAKHEDMHVGIQSLGTA